MNENNFFSKLVQGVGLLFNIGILISQYILRDDFKQVFNVNEQVNFAPFSLVALIIGLVIVIGLYAYRHSLSTRKYLARFDTIKNYYQNTRLSPDNKDFKAYNPEPFYIDGKRLAWSFIILSIIVFSLIFIVNSGVAKGFLYLIFALLIIFSSTVFLMNLYVFEEWKSKEKERKNALDEKIRLFFSKSYKEISRAENPNNFLYPSVQLTIEVDGGRFSVVSDLNDPDKFFKIDPIIEQKINEK